MTWLTRTLRYRRLTVVTGILSIVLMIDILQLWLLTATMNAFLGGDLGVPLPALLVSIGCFLFNAGLLYYLYELEG